MAPPQFESMTYDELTAIYRKEMASNSLAEVRHDFYTALADMLNSIQREYEKALADDPDSIVCEGLNQRRKKMLDISMRIIDYRMDKIASMALKRGEGYGSVIGRMTPEEKRLYQSILEAFRAHRALVPQIRKKDHRIPEIVPSESRPLAEELSFDSKSQWELDVIEERSGEATERAVSQSKDLSYDDENDNMVIRILEDLPTFSGPYRDYSLKKEDVLVMPRTLAEVLIKRKVAVEVQPRL